MHSWRTCTTTIRAGELKELRRSLKADVQGSVDVLGQVADQVKQEVKVNLLHAAVGGISESDVLLADASNAVIIGFTSCRAGTLAGREARAWRSALPHHLRHRRRVPKALDGMLSPPREEVIGHAEVARSSRSRR